MAMWNPMCGWCGSNDCPGCREEPEDGGGALELPPGILDTPEAQDWAPIPGWAEEEE